VRSAKSIVLLGALFLAACTPRNPLDWKIDGRNGNELQVWLDDAVAKMPAPLADEFASAVLRIRDDTHGWNKADPEATNNPLSLRLHGRKVRDVLVEGLQLQAGDLLSRVQNEKSNILRLAQSLERDEFAPADRARLERQIEVLRRSSRTTERAFDALEKRINALLGKTEPN